MIEDTPELKKLVSKRKSRDSDNTTLFKRYDGGFVVFVGANSPHGLRQMSIPVVITDDIDSIEIGSTKEGDPVLRAEKRTQTFTFTSKKIRVSTPTIKGESRIEKFRLRGTNERRYVNCPHCGTQQILQEENITWEKTQLDLFGKVFEHHYETATVACVNGCIITEAERQEILQTAVWIAEHPERKRHRSFWISEITSTLSSLSKIAQAIAEAGDDPESQQTLHNLVYGRTFNPEAADEIDETGLLELCENYLTDENYTIPNGVLYITMGVDIHPDRFEFEIVGWGLNEESWSLVYDRIYGNFDDKRTREQLERVSNLKFKRDDGIVLNISRKAIDAGYQSASKPVYEFVQYRKQYKWFAVKGFGGHGRNLLDGYSKAHQKKIDLHRIGTDQAKLSIYGRLKKTLDESARPYAKQMHFNKKYNTPEYFSMLTAEKAIKKSNGFVSYTSFVKKTDDIRNEALDCRVYAYWAMASGMCKFPEIKARIDKMSEALAIKKEEEKPDENKTSEKTNIDEIIKPKSQRIKKRIVKSPGSNYVTGI